MIKRTGSNVIEQGVTKNHFFTIIDGRSHRKDPLFLLDFAEEKTADLEGVGIGDL